MNIMIAFIILGFLPLQCVRAYGMKVGTLVCTVAVGLPIASRLLNDGMVLAWIGLLFSLVVFVHARKKAMHDALNDDDEAE
tara:strand:+ start:334 stop:576 length:243 start_codon:yes stop_codon:yes gene_type:complete